MKPSLRTIRPSSPNVHRSQPRSSSRSPSTVVPVMVHSDTARFPAMKLLSSPKWDVRDVLKKGAEPAADLLLAGEAPPPWLRPARSLEHAVLREVRQDRFQVVRVETVKYPLECVHLFVVSHADLLGV